jgi:glycosyltransferase involved in cell wall biosynthesis
VGPQTVGRWDTNETPLISVVIPAYNSARWIVQTVESVLAQTYRPVEVIVVNDGSTDDTAEVLAPWMDRIRYVRQANGGVACARNRGIQEARGGLIAFLDGDDFWLPHKLAKQWDCLRADPEAGLVHTDTFELYEPSGRTAHVPRDRARFSGSCYTEFFRANRVHTSTVLVTSAALERAGGFDEKIRFASTEDLDLWIRIARHFRLAYVDEPLIYYRLHGGNASLNQCRMIENEYYVLAKAFRDDSGLSPAAFRDRVRRRVFDLAFQAGYANVERDDLARARGYFREALSYRPLGLRAWMFFASTFLPVPVRKAIRGVKQRLAFRRPETPAHAGAC